jgi:hypothetical protein
MRIGRRLDDRILDNLDALCSGRENDARALDDAYGWLVLWLPLAPVILIGGAVVAAGFDATSSSFGLRFLAGMVATGNCFVVSFGGFFSTLFFAGLTWKLSRNPMTVSEQPFEQRRHRRSFLDYWADFDSAMGRALCPDRQSVSDVHPKCVTSKREEAVLSARRVCEGRLACRVTPPTAPDFPEGLQRESLPSPAAGVGHPASAR